MKRKLNRRYILYWAVTNYLSVAETEKLRFELGKELPQQNKKFLAIVKKYFDFEMLKNKPVIKEDIWVYNYFQYGLKNKVEYRWLLKKYYDEIIVPSERKVEEMKALLV